MSRVDTTFPTIRLSRSSLKRWTLAAAGVCCVAIGAVGAVLPGLPTTVFLIAACWCFTRSCPWLEEKLIRNRFFRPFLPYLEPGAVMPVRAKVIALAMMWTAIAISSFALAARLENAAPAIVIMAIAGAVGTWSIVRFGRARRKESQRPVVGVVSGVSVRDGA